MKPSDLILIAVVAIAGYAWLRASVAQASPHAAGKSGAYAPADWGAAP